MQSNLSIEYVPTSSLKANPHNARTHNRHQRRKIAASVRQFGFLNPIIVDHEGYIAAGHGRWEAAKDENMATVPVIRIEHLTKDQIRAYIIADNKLAELARWDHSILVTELQHLLVTDLDVTLTGFEVGEIDGLLAGLSSQKVGPEDLQLPLPILPISQRREIWLLGKHRLLCGDAQNAADFVRLMDGKTAAAGFCDPPYNRGSRNIGGRGRVKHGDFAFAFGEMSRAEFRKFLKATLKNGAAVMRSGAVQFVCMDWQHIGDLIQVGAGVYGAMLNLAVWNKTNAGQGSFYRSQYEHVAVYRVGAEHHMNNVQLGRFGRNRSNVWTYAGVNTFGKDRMEALVAHPTVKPVALVADAMLDCTARNEIVLDQFCGSGTTIVAAEKVGRIGYGIEYEPKYVDVAIGRWQKFTGMDAVLSGDGRTFGEIAAERSAAMAPAATELNDA
jgi:DNA modification methylase